MPTRRLTAHERRAKAMCEAFKTYDTANVTVEWTKSRMWGMTPYIEWAGEKVASISGCGFCKHSARLAEALCWLGNTDDERSSIASKQGCGVSSVQEALKAIGWNLEPVASSRTSDSYRLSRIKRKGT